jgi:hypothetical protein
VVRGVFPFLFKFGSIMTEGLWYFCFFGIADQQRREKNNWMIFFCIDFFLNGCKLSE